MTAGYPSDARENVAQAAIPAARYGAGCGGGPSGALIAVGAGKCLEVTGGFTTAGTQTQISDCTAAANQPRSQSASHELTVSSGGSRLCLDASGQGASPGTKVVTWTCNGQPNQQWTPTPTPTPTAPSPTPSPVCAWAPLARERPTAPLWSCGPAAAAATRSGRATDPVTAESPTSSMTLRGSA